MLKQCVHSENGEGPCVRCAMEEPDWVKPVSLAVFVIDDSYSMKPRLAATIAGLNENLDGLRNTEEVDYLVTLAAFSNSSRLLFSSVPAKNLPVIGGEHLSGRGGTALFETVGITIDSVKTELAKQPGVSVLFYVITDGEDNVASQFSHEALGAKIAECEKEGNWTFSFIGCDIDTWKSPSRQVLRAQTGNTLSVDSANYASSWNGIREATVNYTSGRLLTRAMTMSIGADLSVEKYAVSNLFAGIEGSTPDPAKK